MIEDFANKKEGDQPSASEWNMLVAEVRRLGKFQVAAPLGMSDGPGGIGLSFDGVPSDPSACVVRLDSNCAGGGKYRGVLMKAPATTACDGSTLSMPEGMQPGDACYISNLAEDGDATHLLGTGKYHPGVITGQAADGTTWLVDIEVGAGNCSPGTDTFTAVTNNAYAGSNFTQTKVTFSVDFCAGTITPGTPADSIVFTTSACPTPSGLSASDFESS